MKIVVSSWPGCGATTLAIILTKMLDYKLYRGSETFRYILKRLNISDTGKGALELERLIQPHFGPVYDKYIDYLLNDTTRDNFIIESDTGAARIGKQQGIFSIFLHANDQTRFEHFKTDGRSDDIEIMKQRDEELQKSYIGLMDFDIFNLEQVSQKYNLLIDNSDINIAQELNIVFNEFRKVDFDENLNLQSIMREIPDEEKLYWDKGKSFVLDLLKAKGQVVLAEEILNEMKGLFPDDFDKLPKDLREAIG